MQVMTARTQYRITAPDMEVVLAVARAGTLAGAGARLGLDASTVFRSIQRIEAALGQRLFERSRTGYRPADVALQLAIHAERIEAEVEAARAATSAAAETVAGSVSVTTTDTLLLGLVLPALESLARRHPMLQFELTATNQVASLTKRDADIAVRATKQPPEHLVGRHVGPIRVALYAPKGRKSRGIAAADPASAPWLAPDDALPEHPSVKWRRRQFPKVVPRFKVNSILAVAEGVAAGLGIGALPMFLAEGRADLLRLTEPLADCETQLWVLTHSDSRNLRRIALVYRHLAEHLVLA